MSTGEANWIVIELVSPLPLQLTAAATVTVTSDGPVTIKSDPLAATELQFIASAKVKVIEVGEQAGGVIVPIGMGVCSATVNEVLLPGFTWRLH